MTNIDNIYSVILLNGTDNIAPLTINSDNTFSYTWSNLAVGNYSLTLNAANEKGNSYPADYDAMKFTIDKAGSNVSIPHFENYNYDYYPICPHLYMNMQTQL